MDNDKCIISILIISSDSINNISLYLNPENSLQNIHFFGGISNNLPLCLKENVTYPLNSFLQHAWRIASQSVSLWTGQLCYQGLVSSSQWRLLCLRFLVWGDTSSLYAFLSCDSEALWSLPPHHYYHNRVLWVSPFQD